MRFLHDMTARQPRIGRFVLRIFLWLPLCFAAWYYLAPYHAAVAARVALLGITLFKTGIVTAIEQPATSLVFVSKLQVEAAPGRWALLAPEVDPLIYTYGLAFFLALMLAARARPLKILLGVAVLLPFQAWSIAFDVLAQVGFRMGPDVARQAGLTGWRVEAIALGYQVGTLMLPTLVPVIAWAWLCSANLGFLRPGPTQSLTVSPEARR